MSSIFDIVIPSAYGAAANPQDAPGYGSLMFMVVIFALFYFMVIRPQTKRQKEQKSLIESLSTGDEVVTSGGIVGRIAQLNDNFVVLGLSNNDGVEITVQKQAISAQLPKGTLKAAAE